ncbi:MAG: TRAP transporter large permease [Microbacterium sp.]
MTTLETREPQLVDKTAKRARRYTAGLIVAGAATVLMSIYLLVGDASNLIIGLVVTLLAMALMLFKIPIGISMIASSMLGLYVLAGPRALFGSLEETVFQTFASWSLSVIPMFVLMGIAMGKSGLSDGAYDTARKWLGRMPGGLAVSTNFAGAGLASTSGSSIGIAYAIGRVAIPEMLRSGYSPRLAVGSVAMAGTLGQVIPPSILLVIYAGVAQTPVGPQILAGIVPGIVLAILFTIVILGWGLFVKDAAPRGPRFSWLERFVSLRTLIPIVIIVIVVLGGIYAGVFTATEAGAFGAGITLVLGLGTVILAARKARRGGMEVSTGAAVRTYFGSTLIETISAVSAVFLLLVGVMLLTRVMALSGLAGWVADLVVDLGLNQISFLLLLIPIYLVLGFFLDTLAMMLLTIPVFIGPLEALDVNLIWFGVFLIVLAEIDLVAPPLGVLNFVVLSIAQSSTKGMGFKITIGDVFKGVVPFIGACIVFLVLLIAFPEIATWLPDLSAAK